MPRRLVAVLLFVLGMAVFVPRTSVIADTTYTCPSGKSSCYQSGYAGLTARTGARAGHLVFLDRRRSGR